MHVSSAVRARLRLEGGFSIRCLVVVSFTSCSADTTMLLLISSTLLNPEYLHFGYPVHSLSPCWHREGRATHTQNKDMHMALSVEIGLISAAAVPGNSWMKPGGERLAAGGCSRAGAHRGGLARWLWGLYHCHQPVPHVLLPRALHPLLSMPTPHHQQNVYPDTCTEDRG